MRQILIKHLEMQHFKGVSHFGCDFGEQTDIFGANGTGKSTIMDAFTWCLFGKDSKDRTDSGRGAFGIKTTDKDGNVIDKLEHSVSITLCVDGVVVELKRVLCEKWTKKRGSTEVVMDGNETKYYWNGVEIKKGDFDKRIAEELINDSTFKVLTNPLHFCNLPWEQQKLMLSRIIGNVTYEDIKDENEEFMREYCLIKYNNMLGREDEYRKSVQATIRKTKEDINSTTHQIEGMKELVPEMPDVEALKEEESRLNGWNDEIDSILRSRANLEKSKYDKISKLNEQISKLRTKQMVIKQNTINAANESTNDARLKKSKLESDIRIAQMKVASMNKEYIDKENAKFARVSGLEAEIKGINADVERLRETWAKIYEEEYSEKEGFICPITNKACGDASAVQFNAEAFEKAKQVKLDNITKNGIYLNEEAKKKQRELDALNADGSLAALNNEIQELLDKVSAMISELNGMDVPDVITDIDVATIPEYMAIEAEVDKLEGEIKEVNTDNISLTEEQKARNKEIKERLTEIHEELGKVKVIDEQNAKIDSYETLVDEYAQRLADAEREEDILNAMRKAIDAEIERRCDEHFSMVKFKLSESQLNGGEVATCYAMVDGVKYQDLNSAKKVNAGLDIINAMCRHLQVYAPIFIDNAEGINELIDTDSQMIRLVVTEDKELKVYA